MARGKQRPRALITGASAGIGEGFARRLARNGYDVVLVARRRERLQDLAAGLAQQDGVSAEVLATDLTRDRDVAQVEERLRAGDVDLLINCAGFGTAGAFADLPLKREMEEIDLNVRALVRLTHAALDSMGERRRGTIINVASTAAFQPVPNAATYAASKAFVLHFSEAVHEEARGRGVTVTCVCPGPVKTEFTEVAQIDAHLLPGPAWTSVDSVVRASLTAARRRRPVVIPGVFNQAAATASRLAPRFFVKQVAGTVFKWASSGPKKEPGRTRTAPARR